MRPASLDWRTTGKYSICSLSLLRSCVFSHAECILSVIAKFLVRLSREAGKGGLKWERGEVGEESGEERRRGEK